MALYISIKYIWTHQRYLSNYFLAACSSDRSIILYDARETGPLRRIIMRLQTNKLSWNPMEAVTFTCANEDYK